MQLCMSSIIYMPLTTILFRFLVITAVQSFVRRKLAIKSTHFIKAKKHEEFARLIEVEWQARVTVRRRNKVLFQMSAKAYSAESSAVVLQARWRAHFTRKYFCAIHHYATAIQLFVRRCFARGKNNQNIRGKQLPCSVQILIV